MKSSEYLFIEHILFHENINATWNDLKYFTLNAEDQSVLSVISVNYGYRMTGDSCEVMQFERNKL